MAEEKGQYTRLALDGVKKHLARRGRPRIFNTAEEVANALVDYIDWCEKNPIMTKRASKRTRDGETETRMDSEAKRRPITINGFCVYLGTSREWFTSAISALEKKENKDKTEEELFSMLLYAREMFRQQQFDGAAVGDFNPNVIMRNIGLNESVDVTSNGEAIKNTAPVINIIRDTRKAGALDEE